MKLAAYLLWHGVHCRADDTYREAYASHSAHGQRACWCNLEELFFYSKQSTIVLQIYVVCE